MPGLLRGVARTAVVAGTATAVSNRVSRRQAGRWSGQEEPANTSAVYDRAPESDMDSRIARLKELSDLKARGVLSEAEFEVMKAEALR